MVGSDNNGSKIKNWQDLGQLESATEVPEKNMKGPMLRPSGVNARVLRYKEDKNAAGKTKYRKQKQTRLVRALQCRIL